MATPTPSDATSTHIHSAATPTHTPSATPTATSSCTVTPIATPIATSSGIATPSDTPTFDLASLERDPGLRRPIWKYPPNVRDDISVEHHYHYDVFNSAIDFQLEELQYRFNDHAVELLRLSSSLEPKNNFGLFDKEQICTLASTFYPADFSQQDMYHLQLQLDHYKIDVVKHAKFQSLSTLSELCVQLVDTRKAEHYNLIYRLICLVLTLPVSTTTTKRVFSAMKLLKTKLRNKMGDEYLRDSMLINVEREFAEDIDIDEFYAQKNRRVQLK